MKIGEKIRAERNKAGLTQSEVADGLFTRNMLSQIESGVASPSLQTLEHIAKKLSLPVAYLLSEDEDSRWFVKRKILPTIENLIAEKRYSEVLAFNNGEYVLDSELCYLLAYSYLECGKSMLQSGNLTIAREHFAQTRSLLAKTRIPSENLWAQLELHDSIAENIASPQLVLDPRRFLALRENAVCNELYHYICEDTEYSYKDELYILHVEAKKLQREKRYADALRYLKQLEDRKSDPSMSAFVLFHVYSDMEICYRELQDYENAYRYASKRISQMNAFKN